ncbi:MAG: tryptophan synthase subunit alpha [Acidimicrobiales bacterium]
MTALPVEPSLRAARDKGGKILVPYMTGGLGEGWTEVLRAMAESGADAVEVGIPFSDPMMDGPTIQAASARALALGATPAGILASLAPVADSLGIPLVAMTYFNLVAHGGCARFAAELRSAGVGGAIVADLSLEELPPWESAALGEGVETVLLAAPTTPDDRLAALCARSHGFVYGVNLMGVTGERSHLAASGPALARRLKATTDKPVLMGFGISSASQAVEAAAEADGVVVASALMRVVLDGGGASEVGAMVSDLRRALDRG